MILETLDLRVAIGVVTLFSLLAITLTGWLVFMCSEDDETGENLDRVYRWTTAAIMAVIVFGAIMFLAVSSY